MALEISKVELHVKENNKEHRTDDVTVKRLMVRRGQNFKITLKTNRQFQPDTDTLIFTAETGPKPSEEKGTRCVFGYPKLTGAKKAWTALVQESGRSSMTLAISSPADASVGSYNLYMREGSHTTPQSITNMVLLFKPLVHRYALPETHKHKQAHMSYGSSEAHM
ncbi:protein-glutamine gamma-glutamyltransferase 5-like [Clupea harengus]|uniref:Protein-glutamine gamma-glutamyltransferase 5-like n=1 Tax=Clupea harengus TaxID=7950 RepID=A0A8M1KK30_CLUHA|nr:protein-glutamine gamma-glutamyltransferase 5-like [Clupea harengus]